VKAVHLSIALTGASGAVFGREWRGMLDEERAESFRNFGPVCNPHRRRNVC
jgi:hypothetical protein